MRWILVIVAITVISTALKKGTNLNRQLARLPTWIPLEKATIADAYKMTRMILGVVTKKEDCRRKLDRSILTALSGRKFAESIPREAERGEFQEGLSVNQSHGRFRKNQFPTANRRVLVPDLGPDLGTHNGSLRTCVERPATALNSSFFP